jgi:hypothetical protein
MLVNVWVSIFQGQISIFNASSEWSAPRTITLERQQNEGFGFSVRGDSPVTVADIEEGSVAAVSMPIVHIASSIFIMKLMFG